MRTLSSLSPDHTYALGLALGRAAPPGAIVALIGDLGAGKTLLAQGIAAGLGVPGPVQSPTFVVAQEHPDGRLPLVHADLYRVESAAELAQIGLDDRLDGVTVVLVEWADRFPGLLPDDHLAVRLLHAGGGRRVEIDARGPSAAAWLEAADV
ncbi:MAG TPA: tRNA (adenosine(37)-N6)-threonylcarbamoyltransferase complex ATPase subunit type 1 TsaE [Myxococcota bacterium]|nr:tRNA (adenosine(37)-N6)-threonylcarbamoyltransferase complex ATPase subunit type 1 TsaE [Myxococcota bacterium]